MKVPVDIVVLFLQTLGRRPKSKIFPVFTLMIREFDAGEQFVSDCGIHHPVLRFPDIRENCSKVRAICDLRRTRRTPLSGAIRANRPISLSARFAEVRLQPADRQLITESTYDG